MNNIAMNSVVNSATIAGFESVGYKVGNLLPNFPAFSGTRIMMMPFHAKDVDGSLPPELDGYKALIKGMIEKAPSHVVFPEGSISYLTIDEKALSPDRTQRKPGLHVDGMYKGELAGAWGGGGGGWGSCGNGMLLASTVDDLCSYWNGHFDGVPVGDGDCAHLSDQLSNARHAFMKAGDIIWADGLMVHEAHRPVQNVNRQFVRVSLPNASPWFIGYTENPLGIKPGGKIINERRVA